jgi:hypothetical protein
MLTRHSGTSPLYPEVEKPVVEAVTRRRRIGDLVFSQESIKELAFVDLYSSSSSTGNFKFMGGMDPFSSLPDTAIFSGDQKSFLITHCMMKRSKQFAFLMFTNRFTVVQKLAPWLSGYEERLEPTSPRMSWLPDAVHHHVLFHATLLCAAAHISNIQRNADPIIALRCKGETMRLANERLLDPVEGSSDHMILVALILLNFQVSNSLWFKLVSSNGMKIDPVDVQEYQNHLRGIRTMVGLRGGTDNLGLRGVLKGWLEICFGPWSNGWE